MFLFGFHIACVLHALLPTCLEAAFTHRNCQGDLSYASDEIKANSLFTPNNPADHLGDTPKSVCALFFTEVMDAERYTFHLEMRLQPRSKWSTGGGRIGLIYNVVNETEYDFILLKLERSVNTECMVAGYAKYGRMFWKTDVQPHACHMRFLRNNWHTLSITVSASMQVNVFLNLVTPLISNVVPYYRHRGRVGCFIANGAGNKLIIRRESLVADYSWSRTMSDAKLTTLMSNTVGVVGQPLELHCASGVIGDTMHWFEYGSSHSGRRITTDTGRFTISSTKLTIKSVVVDDVALYRCIGEQANSESFAHVMVLDMEPACAVRTHPTNNERRTNEGQTLTFKCAVWYTGLWQPVMTWTDTKGNEMANATQDIDEKKASSEVSITALPPSTAVVVLQMYFQKPTDMRQPNATNAPVYKFVHKFPAILVIPKYVPTTQPATTTMITTTAVETTTMLETTEMTTQSSTTEREYIDLPKGKVEENSEDSEGFPAFYLYILGGVTVVLIIVGVAVSLIVVRKSTNIKSSTHRHSRTRRHRSKRHRHHRKYRA